jgi:hypothetical protein
MPAKLQTLQWAVSTVPETAYNTASSTDLIAFTRNNETMTSKDTAFESNAGEIGNTDEFATATFPVSRTSTGTIEKYGDITFMTWALAGALGAVSETGTGATGVYTITPLDIVNTGIQLPSFSLVEQLTDTGTKTEDNLFTGCVINDLTVDFKSGPGRNSVNVKATWIGSGKVTSPSSATVPSLTTQNYSLASAMTITINGTNYVTQASAVSGNFSWSNDLDAANGYYPGSTVDATGFQQRGRLEVGKRKAGFSFEVRLNDSSDEYATLMALTTGTAVLGFVKDSTHQVVLTMEKVQFTTQEISNMNGTVTQKITCDLLKDPSNGLISVTAKCGVDGLWIPA